MTTPTAYNASQDAIIHSTTDYAKLRINPLNRPINQDHLERLYDAIKTRNLLREFPILVDLSGVVLDGQHRLKVAEALGVPVYYIVSADVSIEDIPETNAMQLGWNVHDHLYVWVARGNPEYKKVQEFWEANQWMSLSCAVNLCHYGDRFGMGRKFALGEYKCEDLEFANMVARGVLDFKPYVSFWKTTSFINAVAMLFEHEGYKHQQMMERMRTASTKLVQCPDINAYMAVFTAIYNFKTRQDNKLVFAKLSANDKRRNALRRTKGREQKHAQAA